MKKNIASKLPHGRRFITDAIGLTTIYLGLRSAGMLFSVYISNLIGSEGIGLYQLTGSVYSLFITFSTAGISLAVTRIVSEQHALGNTKMAQAALRRCMTLCILLSTASMMILIFLSPTIGITLLKDERTIIPLKILAVSLPFLAAASTIRGYFLGIGQGISAASTDIVEQLVQIATTIPLVLILSTKGLEYTCIGLVIGAVLSEVVSCTYAVLLYFIKKSEVHGSIKSGLGKQIFSIIVPVSVSSYIRSALTSLENILVPSGLKSFGQSGSAALSQYGAIKGMALPLLFFPSAVLSSFASLLVPEVSAASAIGNQKRISYITSKSIKVTLLFAMFFTGVFLTFSNEISDFIYPNAKIGRMLFALTPILPLIYLDMIVDSILKGLNQQLSSMKYNTADSALRVVIIYLMVPLLGIKGYVLMLYCGTIFNAFLSLKRLVTVSHVRFQLIKWAIYPAACILIACILTRLFCTCGVFFSILICFGLYVVLLIIFKCITKRDFVWLSKIFVKKCR